MSENQSDKTNQTETAVENKTKAAPKKTSSSPPKEFAAIVEQLDKLSALEISKFVKYLEEHWDVSAAPAVAVAAPAAGSETAQPAAEQKTEHDVMLKEAGA